METISKELLKKLLSEVLGKEIRKIDVIYSDGTITYTTQDFVYNHEINVYELAHKCKVWAITEHREDKNINEGNHFYLNHIDSSMIGLFETYQSAICYRGLDKDGDWTDKHLCFHADNEPEAVFKACEWIMEQKK